MEFDDDDVNISEDEDEEIWRSFDGNFIFCSLVFGRGWRWY